jgi:hypothetical protein
LILQGIPPSRREDGPIAYQAAVLSSIARPNNCPNSAAGTGTLKVGAEAFSCTEITELIRGGGPHCGGFFPDLMAVRLLPFMTQF